MTVHVFSGPTLVADEVMEYLPEAVVHPPVAHGDLLRLEPVAGDVMVIIDGYYHQAAPVRHKEILHLIDSGVRVVGCASMGAMRAAELDVCGMIGSGIVYGMYRDGVIDADDEVAVVHVKTTSFEARNVPLVNVRFAVQAAHDAGVLAASETEMVIEAARKLHYTDRSWSNIRHMLADHGSLVDLSLGYLEQHPEDGDVKKQDAIDTLRRLAELVVAAPTEMMTSAWRNELIYRWLVEFRGRDVAGVWVSHADVLRYRQLYDDDFEQVWFDFVQHHLTGLNDLTGDGTVDAITDQARAFVPLRGLHDLMTHEPRLVDGDEHYAAVAEAKHINDTTLWQGRVRLVDRLSDTRLEKHLRALWSVDRDPASLLAAAQNRGFRSTAEAVSALRPYFLRDEKHRKDRVMTRRNGR